MRRGGRSAADRLDLAFGVIEKHLGITRLLDPEDLVKPDKKSVMTYLMCMGRYFSLSVNFALLIDVHNTVSPTTYISGLLPQLAKNKF